MSILFIIFLIVVIFAYVLVVVLANNKNKLYEHFIQTKQHSLIPKIIHKVYIEHSMKLPVELSKNIKEAHKSWTLLNPGYKIKLYSGDDCIKYLQKHFDSEYVDIFNSINAYSGKCNFFRMCVVYNEGGWYSDWKQVCLKPIHKWVHKDSEFVGFYDPYWYLETVKKNCGQPATFGSIPKHPILEKTINLIKENVKNKYYGKGALYTTGPCVYGRAIHEILPKLKSNSYQFGSYIHNYNGYPYMTMNNIRVIQHKCESCGTTQNWENGNNYNELWKNKNYYGEKEE